MADKARLFIVQTTGDFKEIEAEASNVTDDVAALLMDPETFTIHVYKGSDTPPVLKYKAGMAASKLNGKHGHGFTITHLEPSDVVSVVENVLGEAPIITPPKEKETEQEIAAETIAAEAEPRMASRKRPTPAVPDEDDYPSLGQRIGTDMQQEEQPSLGQAVSAAPPATLEQEMVDGYDLSIKMEPDALMQLIARHILNEYTFKRMRKSALPPRGELRRQMNSYVSKLLDDIYG